MTDDAQGLSKFALSVTIPTNPEHDLEHDPSLQTEYANPVTVNNFQIVFANAIGELTDRVVRLKKGLRQLKRSKREEDRKVADLETKVLRKFPPKATQAKTLKTQQAYISARASEMELANEYDTAVAAQRKIEDQIEEQKQLIEEAFDWIEAIKLQSDNGKTFLAYYKFDWNIQNGGRR